MLTVVWGPQTKDQTEQFEKVQRRAARWVSCNYVKLASVTDLKHWNRDGQMLVSVSSIRLYMA